MIIYKVTNKINGHVYIGKSVHDMNGRKNDHYRYARSKFKYKKQYFHRALNKYNNKEFKWEVIDECDDEDRLNELEKYYIYYYDTFNNGYNLTLGGEGNSGWIPSLKTRRKISIANSNPSEETRKRLSRASKGRKLTKHTKNKISNTLKGRSTWNKGLEWNKETRKKMSESRMGVDPWNKGIKDCFNEETIKKMSNSHKGVKLSEKHKKNLSEAQKGRIVSEETRRKISEAQKGKKRKPISEETKLRMSIAQRKRHRSKNNGDKNSKISNN